MDIDRAPLLDRLLAERLHLLDERADAVRLVADQHRKLSIRRLERRLQELRRAADA